MSNSHDPHIKSDATVHETADGPRRGCDNEVVEILSDRLVKQLRTANAVEAKAIWREAQELGITYTLERKYRYGS